MAYGFKKIGVLGGGQLGRMLGLAGIPLGQRFRFLDPSADASALQVGELIIGSYDSQEALTRFAHGLDVVTFEFENVPAKTAAFLEEHVKTFPPIEALRVAQDRLEEKLLFRRLGIPCAPFRAVETVEELKQAAIELGYPCILKTRRLGYDGKGQVVLKDESQIESAWQSLSGYSLILEGFVSFDRELSILAARSVSGEVEIYPLVENVHQAGILRFSLPRPAEEWGPTISQQGELLIKKLLDHFNYVGVLCLETFVKDGQLVANEIAPRVHNSGHWTIEGSETSQFENHLMAIIGQSLAPVELRGRSAMINVIGELPDIAAIATLPGVNLHLYDKAARAGRKIGHITVWGKDLKELRSRLQNILAPLRTAAANSWLARL